MVRPVSLCDQNHIDLGAYLSQKGSHSRPFRAPKWVVSVHNRTLLGSSRGAGGDSATAGQGRGIYAKVDSESEKTLQKEYLFEVSTLLEK